MYSSGGGARVVGRGTEDEQVAERIGGDRVARGAVAGVEPALEADLYEDARALHLLGQAVDHVEVERDGLLAESRRYQPAPRAPAAEHGPASRSR